MKLLSKKYPENTRINNLFMRTDCLRYQIRYDIRVFNIVQRYTYFIEKR